MRSSSKADEVKRNASNVSASPSIERAATAELHSDATDAEVPLGSTADGPRADEEAAAAAEPEVAAEDSVQSPHDSDRELARSLLFAAFKVGWVYCVSTAHCCRLDRPCGAQTHCYRRVCAPLACKLYGVGRTV